MNKVVEKNDNNEDLEIRKVANSNNSNNKLLLIILVGLFCLTLFITIRYIHRYQLVKEANEKLEIIDIKTEKINASIINNGSINETITKETFDDRTEVVVENINAIELMPTKDSKDVGLIYNIRYNIIKNEFKESNIPSNNSEVLVKFSYSYDKEEWTYLNNVISTSSSNISPLIGNTYDIAGLVTNLSVSTNVEIKSSNKEKEIIYWRSETIFKDMKNNDKDKVFEADFAIEYKMGI